MVEVLFFVVLSKVQTPDHTYIMHCPYQLS